MPALAALNQQTAAPANGGAAPGPTAAEKAEAEARSRTLQNYALALLLLAALYYLYGGEH